MQRRARKTCRSGARGEVGVRGGAVTNGLKATRDKKRGGGGGGFGECHAMFEIHVE